MLTVRVAALRTGTAGTAHALVARSASISPLRGRRSVCVRMTPAVRSLPGMRRAAGRARRRLVQTFAGRRVSAWRMHLNDLGLCHARLHSRCRLRARDCTRLDRRNGAHSRVLAMRRAGFCSPRWCSARGLRSRPRRWPVRSNFGCALRRSIGDRSLPSSLRPARCLKSSR
jgi:hypothetical protein